MDNLIFLTRSKLKCVNSKYIILVFFLNYLLIMQISLKIRKYLDNLTKVLISNNITKVLISN